MTNNEVTRTTFVRTTPALHESEDEAEVEAGCYEAEAENVALGPRWPQGLNIPAIEKFVYSVVQCFWFHIDTST